MLAQVFTLHLSRVSPPRSRRATDRVTLRRITEPPSALSAILNPPVDCGDAVKKKRVAPDGRHPVQEGTRDQV
jgi:hypothetical protein